MSQAQPQLDPGPQRAPTGTEQDGKPAGVNGLDPTQIDHQRLWVGTQRAVDRHTERRSVREVKLGADVEHASLDKSAVADLE